MAVTFTRKLFPVSTNCSSCPYDCPYDCFDIPDFYYPTPPPPPPDHQNQLQPLTIALIALFVGFFFTVSFYIIVVKCRGSRSRNMGAEPSQSDGGEGEFLNENQIDHPIWFITTVGLQQSVINLITVCKYKRGEGLIEGTDCSVCLSEFQEDELLRLLPKCSHAFHIGCVDTWLRTHTTCPLCRAQIVTDFASSNSVNQNEANMGVIEETREENLEINGETAGVHQGAVSDGSFENRGDAAEEQREIRVQVGEIVAKEGIFEVEGNETVRNNQMDSSSASIKTAAT